jgi:hypothetical protein
VIPFCYGSGTLIKYGSSSAKAKSSATLTIRISKKTGTYGTRHVTCRWRKSRDYHWVRNLSVLRISKKSGTIHTTSVEIKGGHQIRNLASILRFGDKEFGRICTYW